MIVYGLLKGEIPSRKKITLKLTTADGKVSKFEVSLSKLDPIAESMIGVLAGSSYVKYKISKVI